jgi:CelD/BcsL family acetyltransferase involved in cellulose biosynthesis
MVASVLDSPEAAGGIRTEWDRLAVAAARPFCAPAWMLAWWEHMRPSDAALRIVAVRRADRLIGVVPLFAQGRSYSLLADGTALVEPLAETGLEEEVAEAALDALSEADPRPETIKLSMQDDSPDWVGLFSRGWPSGREAWQRTADEVEMPSVTLEDEGFDGWMQGRSKRFRGEVRRRFRRLEDSGASFRFATSSTLERDLEELLRLHASRLDCLDEPAVVDSRLGKMLAAAGRELIDSGRFRLLSLEMDGKVLAVHLLVAAGPRVAGWNGGFDEAYRSYSPSLQCIVYALQDLADRGQRSLNLGPGDQPYKSRLATCDGRFTTSLLFPPGRGRLRARGRDYARTAKWALRGTIDRRPRLSISS